MYKEMKLVAIVKKVNRKRNKNLVGQLIVIEDTFLSDMNYELCHRESVEDYRLFYYMDSQDRSLGQCIGILHSVSNIEILGEL